MSNVTVQEALKSAIEEIKWANHLHDWHDGLYEALEACKEALAELEETKPIGKVYNGNAYWVGEAPENDTSLYTSPQLKEWVSLHDDDINELSDQAYKNGGWDIEFARYIEAKLKQLNTEG